MKPLALAIALSLALAAPLSAPAQTATPTAAAKAAPEWVNTSNRYAQILLEAQLRFQPESASFFGIPGYDDKIADLGPENAARFRTATAEAKAKLQETLQLERDPNVRQDLEIMIQAADDSVESTLVNERLILPFADAPQLVFQGLKALLIRGRSVGECCGLS